MSNAPPERPAIDGHDVDWPADWDAQRRVEAVADMLRQPRPAAWVAEQAGVTPKTARKYLEELVDRGTFATTTDAETGATLYYPDPEALVMERLRELLQRDQQDLTARLSEIADRIESWQTEFDVADPAGLRATIDEDLPAEERRRRQQIAYEWDQRIEERRLVRAALDIHDPVTDYVAAHQPAATSSESTAPPSHLQ